MDEVVVGVEDGRSRGALHSPKNRVEPRQG